MRGSTSPREAAGRGGADLALIGVSVLAAAVLIGAGDHHGWAFAAGLALTPLYRLARRRRADTRPAQNRSSAVFSG
ncbi:hypothetical protein [Dactylosporangium sp. NPDC049140]|uniref:hypothetical protein n=1 Tax=Dactylosporangium sp. NPDC049140 TaxID=3155647 RepID=UPI0033F2F298